jgi:predicted methyltransferase
MKKEEKIMATYRISRNNILEGSVLEIVDYLEHEGREHLYKTAIIDIEHRGGGISRFYKTRKKYCTCCGKVHGRTIRLISEADMLNSFGAKFVWEECSQCRRGVQAERKPWMKEFLTDEEYSS